MSGEAWRRGLVLGGGGVLGAAWMVGALKALEEEVGVDARDFEAYVGTSAGSVLAALLGGEVASGPLSGFDFDYERDTGGDRPDRPRRGVGSRELLIRNVRQLRQL